MPLVKKHLFLLQNRFRDHFGTECVEGGLASSSWHQNDRLQSELLLWLCLDVDAQRMGMLFREEGEGQSLPNHK